MLHISEVEQPVVGRFYLVPTYREIPVLLPKHSDDGLDRDHYHVDARFVRRVEGRFQAERADGDLVVFNGGDHHDFLPHEPPNPKGLAIVIGALPDKEISAVAHVCLNTHEWRRTAVSGATNRAMRPIRVGCRLICPHRGADVTNIPITVDGFARCPLHGQVLDMRLGGKR